MDDLVQRLEKMGDRIPAEAKAQSDKEYLENYKHCKKAILMSECFEKTNAAKEAYAYRHPEYIEMLQGLKEATYTYVCEKLTREKLKMDVQVWQTTQANNRFLQEKV